MLKMVYQVLNQTCIRKLVLDVGVVEWRSNEPGCTEGRFQENHSEQEFPCAGSNSRADYFCVEKIFQLVNHHQKDQGCDRNVDGNREAHDADEGKQSRAAAWCARP